MTGRKYDERLSQNTAFPKWIRIGYFLKAHMGQDGHLPLKKGELKAFLGESSVSNLNRSIKRAIDNELIHPMSNELCLVAPSYEVAYMKDGSKRDHKCPFHEYDGAHGSV